MTKQMVDTEEIVYLCTFRHSTIYLHEAGFTRCNSSGLLTIITCHTVQDDPYKNLAELYNRPYDNIFFTSDNRMTINNALSLLCAQ